VHAGKTIRVVTIQLMKPLYISSLTCVALTCSSPPPSAREAGKDLPIGTPCRVERVIDGDTFYCQDGEKIRLTGIDAPERDQGSPYRQSRDALTRMLPRGLEVRLELDVESKDQYRRTLAYAWSDSLMVNEQMIRRGWAMQYTVPPNVRYAERLRVAERAARDDRAGHWGDGGFTCSPSEHRRRHC
jgi:micrococcal nuclease